VLRLLRRGHQGQNESDRWAEFFPVSLKIGHQGQNVSDRWAEFFPVSLKIGPNRTSTICLRRDLTVSEIDRTDEDVFKTGGERLIVRFWQQDNTSGSGGRTGTTHSAAGGANYHGL
jgi:hypothetical protein